jgi:TonB family protein
VPAILQRMMTCRVVLRALVLAVLPALLQGCATKAATAPPPRSTTLGPIADWTGRIPLDSEDPRYRPYLEQVKKKIKDQWSYPCLKQEGPPPSCEYKATELEVEFGILRDGRVQFVEVMRQSDYAIYNEYAVNAINRASPFPPVPPEMMATRPGSTGVPIRARFIYIVPTSTVPMSR